MNEYAKSYPFINGIKIKVMEQKNILRLLNNLVQHAYTEKVFYLI